MGNIVYCFVIIMRSFLIRFLLSFPLLSLLSCNGELVRFVSTKITISLLIQLFWLASATE